MRFLGMLLIIIVIVSACSNNDDGALPTLINIPAPTKTLIPTQPAIETSTEEPATVAPTDEPSSQSSDTTPTTQIGGAQLTATFLSHPQQSLTTPIQPTNTQIPLTNTLVPPTEDVPGQAPSASPTTEATSEPVIVPSATHTPTTAPTTTATNTEEPCEVKTEWDIYSVQRGDNLVTIANRTGSTIAELTEANCLANPNRLLVGQELHVPDLPPTATQQSTLPAFSVSITKTFHSEKGFEFEYPADWFIDTAQSPTVDNVIITSFEYTLGDEIPQSLWTEEMVSITITTSDNDQSSLEDWTQTSMTRFQNASNIESVNPPQAITTDSGLEGIIIDYLGRDGGAVRNIYFVIGDHKVQLNIGGNFDLATTIIDSIQVT